MGFFALLSSMRSKLAALRTMGVLFLHTARGFDIFIGGHQTLLDAVLLAHALENGDSVLALIALARMSLEVVGTIHAVTILARDHQKWWRTLGKDECRGGEK